MKKTLYTLSTLVLTAGASQAVVLASYSLTAGSLSEDSGSGLGSATDLTLLSTNYTDPVTMLPATYQFVTDNVDGTITADDTPTADFYNAVEFTYTVSLAAGETLGIDSASVEAITRPGGNGRRLSWLISEDGGATFDNLGTRPNSGVGVNTDTTISNTVFTDGDMFTLRLLVRDAIDTADIYELDNITLNGTITPVPEPTSAALLGLGGLALMMRRHK